MKTRKQIIKDIDQIWDNHVGKAFNYERNFKSKTRMRSLPSKIASYIVKHFKEK